MGTGKQYDEEFKKQTIKLTKEIGTKAAAYELCIPKGTLGTWVQKARIGEIDTGAYYEPIANALHNQGIFVSVVNPLLIDDYSACLIPAFQMPTHYSLHLAESLTGTKNGSISC